MRCSSKQCVKSGQLNWPCGSQSDCDGLSVWRLFDSQAEKRQEERERARKDDEAWSQFREAERLLKTNQRAAVDLFRKAAAAGNVHAQISLGWCLANGKGVSKNEKAAVEWYRKAAAQSNPEAQFHLGECFAEGRGVAQDEKQAVELFTKAAENGFAAAQLLLGLCLFKGSGVAKDEQMAASWLLKAVSNDVLHDTHLIGRVDCAYPLLHAKADVDRIDRTHRETALVYAARSGHKAAVRQLLRCSASLSPPSGSSPLSAAVMCNHDEVVEVLLESGAEPSTSDLLHWDPSSELVDAFKDTDHVVGTLFVRCLNLAAGAAKDELGRAVGYPNHRPQISCIFEC